MAIIACPVCGAELSDRASKCAHCGSDLTAFRTGECSQCGARFIPPAAVCPECGHSISTSKTRTQFTAPLFMRKIVIAVAIIAIVVIAGVCVTQWLSADNFESKFMNAASDVLDRSEEAAELLGQLGEAWDLTDRETAITLLWTDDVFVQQANLLVARGEVIWDDIEDLQDAPDEYQDVYTALVKSYDGYLKLIDLLGNPSNDLDEYVNEIFTAIDEVTANYEVVRDYFN